MLRRLAAGAVVAAALVFPLSGCGLADKVESATAAKPSASPEAKPAEVLAAAVTKTAATNVTYVVAGETPDDNLTATYDATKKIALLKALSDGDNMELTVTAEKLYLAGLADLQGKTFRLQLAKVPADNDMAIFADVFPPATLLTGVTEVKATGSGAFAGILDLTKAQGATVGAKKFLELLVGKSGDKATAIKFTAAVDKQGYLTEFKATLYHEGAEDEYAMTFSGHGNAVTVTEPSGKNVIEAPAEMYKG